MWVTLFFIFDYLAFLKAFCDKKSKTLQYKLIGERHHAIQKQISQFNKLMLLCHFHNFITTNKVLIVHKMKLSTTAVCWSTAKCMAMSKIWKYAQII